MDREAYHSDLLIYQRWLKEKLIALRIKVPGINDSYPGLLEALSEVVAVIDIKDGRSSLIDSLLRREDGAETDFNCAIGLLKTGDETIGAALKKLSSSPPSGFAGKSDLTKAVGFFRPLTHFAAAGRWLPETAPKGVKLPRRERVPRSTASEARRPRTPPSSGAGEPRATVEQDSSSSLSSRPTPSLASNPRARQPEPAPSPTPAPPPRPMLQDPALGAKPAAAPLPSPSSNGVPKADSMLSIFQQLNARALDCLGAIKEQFGTEQPAALVELEMLLQPPYDHQADSIKLPDLIESVGHTLEYLRSKSLRLPDVEAIIQKTGQGIRRMWEVAASLGHDAPLDFDEAAQELSRAQAEFMEVPFLVFPKRK